MPREEKRKLTKEKLRQLHLPPSQTNLLKQERTIHWIQNQCYIISYFCYDYSYDSDPFILENFFIVAQPSHSYHSPPLIIPPSTSSLPKSTHSSTSSRSSSPTPILPIPKQIPSPNMSTKLMDVEAFDGKPDRLEIFVMQILGVMDIEDKKLNTNRKKIAYTLGKFTDIATQWRLNWMKEKRDKATKNKTTPDYGTFQDFLEIVGKTFSDPMEKERAHQSLKMYKQGGLPMYTFLAQFENLARKAEYFGEDNYLISLLKPACDGHLVILIIMDC
jgi:hypothetical protein